MKELSALLLSMAAGALIVAVLFGVLFCLNWGLKQAGAAGIPWGAFLTFLIWSHLWKDCYKSVMKD